MKLADRFWSKVIQLPCGGCWIWDAHLNRKGYGKFKAQGKAVEAYRIAYELEIGAIPKGLDLDHLCRNRACVNPSHLEPVTRRENIRRGKAWAFNSQKTHCPRGHPYSGDNLYVNNGRRACRECARLRWKAWKARNVTLACDSERSEPGGVLGCGGEQAVDLATRAGESDRLDIHMLVPGMATPDAIDNRHDCDYR